MTQPEGDHPKRDLRLLISEIFGPTIQGEGPAAGQRAVFIRTGGCPVGCTWCDSRYSWDPQDRHDSRAPKRLVITEVATQAIRLAGDAHAVVVITGGEPLAQAEPLHQLVLLLREANLSVHLETAGVHEVPDALLRLFNLIVVSPKLSNAGPTATKMRSPEKLRQLAALDQTWFKFVITGTDDLPEVAAVVDQASARRVMVMPEGTIANRSLQLTRDIADEVIQRGWSISPRLHIWLWGDAPGR